MARKLTCYMPGMAAVTPTADWCEFIAWEQRCEASSRREVIYGSACGRWCFPNQTKHAIIDIWSAGGNGGGACCCQQGGASQGGGWVRSCISAGAHTNLGGASACYVVAHGGCCREMWGQDGCYSMMRIAGIEPDRLHCVCVCGGLHERPSCYRFYCCHAQAGGQIDKNAKYDTNSVGTKPKTEFSHMCHSGNQSYNYSGGRGGSYQMNPLHHGRAPWVPAKSGEEKNNHKKSDGFSTNRKNNIFIGTNHGKYGPVCDDEKNLTYQATFSSRCAEQMSEYCAAAFKNIGRTANTAGYGENSQAYIPWVANECYQSCNDWQCGMKVYTTARNGTRASVRFINLTNRNDSRARGGWEHSQWFLCHNGSNNNLCYANIRTVGFGGKTAHVCGGPCCCGGWGGHGAIVVKYKGGIKDDADGGRWN